VKEFKLSFEFNQEKNSEQRRELPKEVSFFMFELSASSLFHQFEMRPPLYKFPTHLSQFSYFNETITTKNKVSV
jgi:hypothetical protein